ncbi:hypothetical protein CDL12_07649 [Handroanthus impetiginosus]|uniref:BHLH domain-containing protein n=1 Tax=Handroanthus impetiginosus TaxID=429701 RepID=A0A2G9HQ66_9LAMI|nr:hypothetical protein CDL12_07649 [Handroanthus impetiginosus]
MHTLITTFSLYISSNNLLRVCVGVGVCVCVLTLYLVKKYSSGFSLCTHKLSHSSPKLYFNILRMSGRRSRQLPSGSSSRITDDQIIELVSKLHQLLPEIRNSSSTRRSSKTSANKVLQETCNYIRNLHKEMDDLSERLSQLLSTIDADSPEAAIIRTLI